MKTKRKWGIVLALAMGAMMASAALASPADHLREIIASLNQEAQPQEGSQEGEPQGGESQGESQEGESQGGPSGGQDNVIDEPDGSGIPKDEPVSKTGTAYGYAGMFNIDTAIGGNVNFSEGENVIENEQRIFWGGPVIQNSGDASLIVRDSYIRGETAVDTAPLAGNPGNLLVAGNVRATLALGNSQNFYINSTVASRNWAALSTDGAEPALQPGQKELSLYAYGSEAITMDGGYGAYSDLFCNLYSYGSHIQAAETGIISGTYGTVNIGTIEDGENDIHLAAKLLQSDKDKRSDKKLGSVIEGGRNALMIHSVNLPPYWEYEGYSQEELPKYNTKINGHGSVLRTDLSLDKGITYEPQKQAYIDHTKGSVILIKSTNVLMELDECTLVPDANGTGYLIQTVYNNDTMFMNAVPDGEYYTGIGARLIDMNVAGDIAHEDYQRQFELVLQGTTLNGAVNEYDCEHWKTVAAQEGFTDYSLDEAYNTHQGIYVGLNAGSVWNVTKESHISALMSQEDCAVNGIVYLDGAEQDYKPGDTLVGNIVVKPGTPSVKTAENTEKSSDNAQPVTTAGQSANNQDPKNGQPGVQAPAQPATQPSTQPATQPSTQPVTPPSTEHVHEWVKADGGYPSTCTQQGKQFWKCSTCGLEYTEIIPATGHNWVLEYELPPSCTYDGSRTYRCSACGNIYSEPTGEPAHGHKTNPTPIITALPTCTEDGEQMYQCEYCLATVKTEPIPALGHNWVLTSSVVPSCNASGKDVYTCTQCGETHVDEFAPTGHDWQLTSETKPTCDAWGQDVYTCTQCGETFTDDYAPLGHDWQLTSETWPTCDDWGKNVYTCSQCGAVYTEDVEPYGHNWAYQYTVPVSCLISGYDVYECTNCGMIDYWNDVPAPGHSYTVYPTPGAESVTHTYYCTVCGDSYTEYHSTDSPGGCYICGYYGSFGERYDPVAWRMLRR